ncbi:MAG: hypothetical protein ACD_2C00181G0013 [uncultured bacterium (gcode 4)]|uniref:Uncharacterized protein n=1 Tax=uncultured bacterium (gcode 4) TaxID=1234023 RepID=K2H0Q9_9BACT|nr:MAG: hypothetical protein ACD_2C00181G0013 [uncultured bacterium (gcode 4)]
MIWIFGGGKITFSTFPEALNTMFSEYPDIPDMLINKVIFDAQDEGALQEFMDNMNAVNEENGKLGISDHEERLLVDSFRSLLQNYDSMKVQRKNLFAMRQKEEEEKNLLWDDLNLTL